MKNGYRVVYKNSISQSTAKFMSYETAKNEFDSIIKHVCEIPGRRLLGSITIKLVDPQGNVMETHKA